MTITVARIHYDAGQALGVWDFRTPAAVKPYKTSRANMRIIVIGRITIREAHVPPLEGLHLFSYGGVALFFFLFVRKSKSFWRCLFTFSSMEELHLF